MSTIKAIGRGVRAALKAAREKEGSKQFEVADRIVTCSHCGGKAFKRYDLFESLQVAPDPRAYGLECAICHHLELFAIQP